ncbi:Ig-like domain-containing protein [Nocardioides sp. LS1]|uniref:Ig-like domain-containing protein n=1 Tax=Nocardioides sp. LS1 TaxID=1027620 RepID=UPI000FFAA0ED|nr:Ig-like domain-containing protein [Nocardioides sp. LS1]GCD90582.1 hypothetical protein NLS1_25880 [Nocardioides sp. LS1]
MTTAPGGRSRRLGALGCAALTAAALACASTTVGGPADAAPAGTVHLPDLTTVIPTDSFSIVDGPDGREFRYTHLVFNRGEGPLRIEPSYSEAAGTYLGHQQLMTHDAGDTWSVVDQRRIADAFTFHAEHGHFHFPLATFGLFEVAPGGGVGAAVTMSPKVGFCISDSYIYDDSLEHAGVGHDWWGSCADPTTLRGLSVGGADEYDYRDPGQSVPLDGVPDGTYWFRAMSDPNNDFVESDESNNETDVLVTLSQGTVTVGTTTEPDTTPCTSELVSPAGGDTVSGTVALTSTTSAGNPARVRYLVDGTPVGSTTAGAPYAVDWASGTVVDGQHWLAARVTTGAGRVCTSPVRAITVDNSSGPDHAGPMVTFTDPEAGSTVGGRVAVAVRAVDASGVDHVQFLLDGKPLKAARTAPPYTVIWNSRETTAGTHHLGARAVDTRGNATTRTIRVEVVPTTPPKPLSIDVSVVARGSDSLTTPKLSTSYRREVLLALVSYDGPAGADGQSAKVSGAGLTWHLVKRSSSQSGVSEIWAARTTARVGSRTVTATPATPGYDGMLSVISVRNGARVGVAAAAGAPSGAPDFYVPAVQEGSLVLAAGNDWDAAVARTPVSGQIVRRQWLDTAAGDTFWVQALTRPTTAHRLVTIRDTAPTADQWNYVGAEVVARH